MTRKDYKLIAEAIAESRFSAAPTILMLSLSRLEKEENMMKKRKGPTKSQINRSIRKQLRHTVLTQEERKLRRAHLRHQQGRYTAQVYVEVKQ
jgi:hypothetical protein